jgi:hypothetical protein
MWPFAGVVDDQELATRRDHRGELLHGESWARRVVQDARGHDQIGAAADGSRDLRPSDAIFEQHDVVVAAGSQALARAGKLRFAAIDGDDAAIQRREQVEQRAVTVPASTASSRGPMSAANALR